ncbi:MAG: hypothetical protein QM487_06300 [Candidatus Marithrix sp.]
MNKQAWLDEAIDYIDSLNFDEFEEFIMGCVPRYEMNIDFDDIKLGKNATVSKAANMDCYYTDNISLAA